MTAPARRGRPPVPIGELGTVTVIRRGASWQARARTRTGGGALARVSATAQTEADARSALAAKAARLGLDTTLLSATTTLAALFDLWLADKRKRGKVEERSLLLYQRHVGYVNELAGAIAIGDLHPGRVEEILERIWEERSLAAARKCGSVLRGAFAFAVRRRALEHSPMVVLEPLPAPAPVGTALTVAQVGAPRAAIRHREERIKVRFGRDAPNLRLVVEVLLASGLRVAEAVALRHRDVDLDAGVISVSRTLIVGKGGAVVEDGLKGRGQERVIHLPAFGIAALREARTRCTNFAARRPDAPAIQSEAGTWVLPANLRRALRSLSDDVELVDALAETGLTAREITPHTLRRTTATLLARHDGRAQAAQELLGHANESTTRGSYIAGPYRRITGSAAPLEELLGGVVAS